MLKQIRITLFAAAGVLAIATASVAAQAGERNRDGYKDRQVYGDRNYNKFRHHKARRGPPRWAPARGWRQKRRHYREYRRRNRHYGGYRTPVVYRGANVSADGTLFGGLIGAVIGGVVGSHIGKGSGNTAAIVGGSVIGAVIGGNIGQSMERADHASTAQVLETGRTGNTVAWRNADTGAQYRVTPTRTYQAAPNQYCREFNTWAVIGGYEEKLHGTACRMPDGSWKRVI